MVQHRDRTTGDVYLILNGNNRFLEGYLIKTVRRRGGRWSLAGLGLLADRCWGWLAGSLVLLLVLAEVARHRSAGRQRQALACG